MLALHPRYKIQALYEKFSNIYIFEILFFQAHPNPSVNWTEWALSKLWEFFLCFLRQMSIFFPVMYLIQCQRKSQTSLLTTTPAPLKCLSLTGKMMVLWLIMPPSMNLINVKSENKHQHHFKGFHLMKFWLILILHQHFYKSISPLFKKI